MLELGSECFERVRSMLDDVCASVAVLHEVKAKLG
jgi:hypothetical protein